MKHLYPKLSVQRLPWPTDWHALFDSAAQARPLILEIGFGYGHYLRHLATQHPDACIVGLEIDSESLRKAERAIARGDLPNVRVVYGRAETALHHNFAAQSLDAVHINFPDPWFKTRHGKRRLMQRDTLDAIVSRLKVGGTLNLATDIIEYAEMSAALLADTPALENLYPAPWVNQVTGRTVTKYERRAFEEGRTCYYFAYQRSGPDAPPVPVLMELEMPHIVFESSLSPQEIYAQFTPHQVHEQEIAVNYINAFHSENAVLFEIYLYEPTIEQRIAVMLTQNDGDPREYTLRLGTIGQPRSTAGTHVAVRHLGDWILSLDPRHRVIHDKVRRESGA